MGQIQQGINQLFTTAGIMANLSPQLRQMAETRTKLSNLRQQEEAATKARDVDPNIAEKAEYQQDIHDIKKQIFETKPTAESYRDYQESALVRGTVTTEADAEEIALERAENAAKEQEINQITQQLLTPYSPDQVMGKMAEKGKAKVQQKAQRRDFMKALGAEQVNFGAGAEGTVSDLPKNLQKAIASGFSKAERKELLDKYYGSK